MNDLSNIEFQQQELENDNSSKSVEYPKLDMYSKPTNFATIQSSKQNALPRISLNSVNVRKINQTNSLHRVLHSRSKNLPNIEMRLLAKKNWINAEIKTFPVWHDLNKSETVLRNSLPSLESKSN